MPAVQEVTKVLTRSIEAAPLRKPISSAVVPVPVNEDLIEAPNMFSHISIQAIAGCFIQTLRRKPSLLNMPKVMNAPVEQGSLIEKLLFLRTP